MKWTELVTIRMQASVWRRPLYHQLRGGMDWPLFKSRHGINPWKSGEIRGELGVAKLQASVWRQPLPSPAAWSAPPSRASCWERSWARAPLAESTRATITARSSLSRCFPKDPKKFIEGLNSLICMSLQGSLLQWPPDAAAAAQMQDAKQG